MANRRRLKKSVKMITGDLFADCVALSMCQQADQKVLDEIMTEVLCIHGDFVARISHTEKGSEKVFYSKLKKEFTEKVNALNERIVKA